MIALPQNLPLVRWRGKRDVPLSEGWLAEIIDRSANRAGYLEWPWTADILKALVCYLRVKFRGTRISSSMLQKLIKTSLIYCGYADIAAQLTLVAPRVIIYLPELAQKSGLELLFFSKLGARLDEAAALHISGVKLEGLRECVKILQQAGRWHGECAQMGAEIVCFTRRKLTRYQTNMELVIV